MLEAEARSSRSRPRPTARGRGKGQMQRKNTGSQLYMSAVIIAVIICSTARAVSSGVTPEPHRCPVAARSESPATGVAYSRSVRSRIAFPVVINDRQPGRSAISQPDVDEIGCSSAQQFQWPNISLISIVFQLSNCF